MYQLDLPFLHCTGTRSVRLRYKSCHAFLAGTESVAEDQEVSRSGANGRLIRNTFSYSTEVALVQCKWNLAAFTGRLTGTSRFQRAVMVINLHLAQPFAVAS